MEYWSNVIDDSTLYTFYGRTGDLLKLETMMDDLGIYTEQGSKDVSCLFTIIHLFIIL